LVRESNELVPVGTAVAAPVPAPPPNQIGAGTSEIRRMLIGRELFDKSA
jgi:hypothetical protein